jgi:hypothetical protein
VKARDENAGKKPGRIGWIILGVAFALVVAAAVVLEIRRPNDKVSDAANDDFVTVIVSTEDIPASRRLDPLIDHGIFIELEVPHEAFVQGAVTELEELRGAATRTAILANEQIPVARLWTGESGTYQGVTYEWCQDRRGFYSPGMTDLPETSRDESTPTCILWGAGSNEIG